LRIATHPRFDPLRYLQKKALPNSAYCSAPEGGAIP
jgi:hypothetical protein